MKLSKATLSFLNDQQCSAEFTACIAARIQGGCQNLPKHLSEKSADYYRGLQQGAQCSIEAILMAHGQYKGFQEKTIKVFGHEAKFNQYLF